MRSKKSKLKLKERVVLFRRKNKFHDEEEDNEDEEDETLDEFEDESPRKQLRKSVLKENANTSFASPRPRRRTNSVNTNQKVTTNKTRKETRQHQQQSTKTKNKKRVVLEDDNDSEMGNYEENDGEQQDGDDDDAHEDTVLNESTMMNNQNEDSSMQQQENQNICDVVYMNKAYQMHINEKLGLIRDARIQLRDNQASKSAQAAPPPAIPKVNITSVDNYELINCHPAYELPPNFIKYIEKTEEELYEEIEYDMDEEDLIWLKLLNEKRAKEFEEIQNNGEKKENDEDISGKIVEIDEEKFEFLMDRLEKESHFQSASVSSSQAKSNDDSTSEDALCCICLDGECVNSNVILFCDMCNLPVHQECYGVPYIPEGQWLCRRCISSPSTPVDCILCPNKYGAFKQTDRGDWAHVACAIWIPEVHFANTVFLEPIIGIENIDKARYRLNCYICRKKNAGACIQCDKQNCYTAFHVTCAQQAGLYMCVQEDTSNNRKKANQNTSTSSLADVRKCVFCDIHTPLDVLSPQTQKKIKRKNGNALNWNDSVACEEALKQAQKERMKRARKILAEKRNAAPVVSIPVIPSDRIQEIMNQIDDYLFEKEKFFKTIMSYWQIKRYSRNGVPLLRRLQNTAGIVKKNNDYKAQKAQIDQIKDVEFSSDDFEKYKEKAKEQLTYMKKLRQDLERARLLMELIRKRERLKRENVLIHQMIGTFEMNPFNMLLQRLLDNLIDLDKGRIFFDPVDINQVPNYLDEIKEPMDFSTMQKKLSNHAYTKFEIFEADFNLIINNCFTFNQKNSFYYKAAFKLREQASSLIKQAKRAFENLSTQIQSPSK